MQEANSLGLRGDKDEDEAESPPEDRHALARRLGGGKQRPVQACCVILERKWVCEIHIQTPNLLLALRGPELILTYTRNVLCQFFNFLGKAKREWQWQIALRLTGAIRC